ncbi:MAG: serine/threonine-protein kinase [Candidatus Hermodarchaeota archaeon]
MMDNLTVNKLNSLFPNISFEHFLLEGGQKKVFKGKKDGQEVVIKFIPIDNKSDLQRITREIVCMKEIKSKHLVKLIDCFPYKIDNQQMIILIEEFIDGTTLRDVINSKPSLELSIRLLEVLLNLLNEFDKKNIIHRDIKPENIMISGSGEIILLDFGVARMLNEDSITHSKLPMAPGTFIYCAPEQLHNKKQLQDIRTDLYSCGIVFFETAVGILPFEEDEFGDCLTSKLDGKRRKLKDFMQTTPGIDSIDELFLKLTNIHQHERYRKPRFALEKLEEIKGCIKC